MSTIATRQRYALDLAEVERTIRLLVPAGNVVEVRAPKAISAQDRRVHVIAGYFDDPVKLAAALGYITEAEGIYITLNEFDPAHLALAANRLVDRPAQTIADAHIRRRLWLLVDLDPERPVKSVSSTDAEHALALGRARRIAEAMMAEWWPAPILADSGNGAHLLWRIDLPADDGGLVQRCLQALAARFDDALVKVDQSVYNPARISKLYGTWARKGDDTPERPHRMARLLEVPDPVVTVSRELLEALAARAPVEPQPSQSRPARQPGDFDLARWIAEHLPDARGPRPWPTQAGQGRKWIIDCPWNPDHAGGCAYVAELGNGAITAGCLHQSCTWAWEDLRTKFEPGYRASRNGDEPRGAYARTAHTRRPVAEIIADLEALRPEEGGKPERTLAEARALKLAADCAGLNRADLQRVEIALRGLGLTQEFIRNWRAAVRETHKGPPPRGDDDADRPASWPYLAEDGRTWLLHEVRQADGSTRFERTLVADFVARITEEAIGEAGDKHWTVEGQTAAGQTFSIEIPALEFADPKALSAKLTQAAGPQAPVRAKMAAHLPPAIQLCSQERPRQLRRFERTGWDDGGRFLIPGREPPGVRIALQQAIPYRISADADLAQGLAALTDLIEAMGPERTMIILAAMTIGPIARLAGWENERSALFVAGRTGTLKTSTMQVAMSLWGSEFMRDDRLIRWGEGSTANAIMAVATYASDLPLLIDNYKPGVAGGAKTFRALIHAIVEGSEKLRLKSTAELREQKLISCWPLFTGEDTPSDDAASLARVLVLRFDWPRGQANERLARAQQQAHHLNAVGASLLDWLESDDSRPVISMAAAQFVQLRSAWAQRIMAANRNATNPLRVASNLATNQLTIWILRHHPEIGPVIAPYVDQHTAGLLNVATDMAQRTAESLEATRFLHTLQELLATGELVLIPESGRDSAGREVALPLPERRGGWRAEDGSIYLLGQKALSDVLKKIGQDGLGNISLATLYDQLAALGLIASHSRGGDKCTRVVRIAAEGNRPIRVLHLKAEALEQREGDDDVPTVL